MARIVFVADRFDGMIEGILRGLYQQRQEILFVTDQQAQLFFPDDLRELVQVITPFKKWNPFEAVRALPHISKFNPEVWHFVHGSPEARHTSAHWILAGFARSQPGQVLISSILSDQVYSEKLGRMHFHLFDAITFSTRMQMMQFRREKRIPDSSHAEVLFPSPLSLSFAHEHIRPEVSDLLAQLGDYIFFPVVKSKELLRELSDIALLNPQTRLLIHQERNRGMENLFFAPDISPNEAAEICGKARAICLAFGDFSIEELQMYWSWAQAYQVPLWVNLEQADRLPGIAVEGKTGWILSYGLQSLREVLLQNPIRTLKKEAKSSHDDFADSNLNQIVRLYHRMYEKF